MQSEATPAGKSGGKSDRGSAALKRIATAWRSLPDRLGGIAGRLLVRVLLFSSVITLLLTLTQLYLDYRRDVQAIDQRMSEIDSGYRQSLGEGLWRVDRRQLQLQVEGIFRLPDISYVELREATDGAAPLMVTAGSHRANPPAATRIPIFYADHGSRAVARHSRGRSHVRPDLSPASRHRGHHHGRPGDKDVRGLLFHPPSCPPADHTSPHRDSDVARRYDLRGSQAPLRLERRPPRPADELDHLVEAFNQREMALREAERRNLDAQMQLVHANRIATMGQLAASLAHEVSDPIGATLMNAGTAERWLATSPPNLDSARLSIDRIVADSRRATDIVGRIRDLAKKAPAHRETLEINEVVLEIIGLTRSEMSNNGVSLQTRLTDDLPIIWGDRVQLQQVIPELDDERR